MLFGGGIISSVVFFYIWIDRIFAAEGASAGLWVLITADTLLYGFFLVVCMDSGMGVVALGKQRFNIETRSLEWLDDEPEDYRKWKWGILGLMILISLVLAFFFLPDSILSWRAAAFPWI